MRAKCILPIALYVAGLIAVLVFAALQRGPWTDEFWSLWLTDSSLPFSAVWGRWVEDSHPPLYSALLHGVSSLEPFSIPIGRLLNIVPLIAFLIVCALFAAYDRKTRKFTLIFAAALTSSAMFITYFAEMRSYFLGICAFAVLMLSLRRLMEPASAGESGLARWLPFAVALILCINVHYVTALITVLTVGTFGLFFLYRRRYGDFARVLILGIIACLILVAFAAQQYSLLQNTGTWITTTTLKGAAFILRATALPILGQVVLLVLVFRMLWNEWRSRALLTDIKSGRFTFTLLIIAALGATSIVLLALHARSPMVQERYVMVMGIAALAGFTSLAELVDFSSTRMRALVAAQCAALVLFFGWDTAKDRRWDLPAEKIEEHLAQCPASRVIVRDLEPSPVKNENLVRPFAYTAQARRVGIPTENLNARNLSPAGNCPDIVWIPHTDTRKIPLTDPEAQAAYFAKWNPDYSGASVKAEIFGRQSAIFIVR